MARTRRYRALVLAGVVVVGLLAGACSSLTEDVGPSTTSTTTTTAPAGPPDPGPGPTTLEGVSVRLRTIVAALEDDDERTRSDGTEVPELDQPVALAPRPGRNQLWVAERPGRLRIVAHETRWDSVDDVTEQGGYTLLPGPALDISDETDTEGERGLLGLAFSSDGRTLYLHHTVPGGDVTVAAYTVEDDRAFTGGTGGDPPPASSVVRVDEASRVELLRVPHGEFSNHNGGQLAIGPDGYLYVAIGDGGGSGDPGGNGQDTETLLGTILRIDPAAPDGFVPFSIPPDNPFVGGGGRPEIYLHGARNPWRFSFDQLTGDLWVADVGQNEIEEINWLPALFGAGRGANLGWSWFEGDERFRTEGTPPEDVIPPFLTYDHTDGRCSVTGGYVYRGPDAPGLDGAYVYGDYCTGEIRGLLSRRGILLDDRPLGISVEANTLVSFGQGEDGELFVVTSDGGLAEVVA